VIFSPKFSKVGVRGEHVDLAILDNNLQKTVQQQTAPKLRK
jgi:hypothetical protein